MSVRHAPCALCRSLFKLLLPRIKGTPRGFAGDAIFASFDMRAGGDGGCAQHPTPPAAHTAQTALPRGQIALGVMLFKSLGGGGEQEWRREALRDGLNAQLSQLSGVKVYSKEFIDFLMSRKGLTDVEAASELGIKKMLSGSFVVVGGKLRVETHIVDVETGLMESSYTTVGDESDLS